jgi:hypothetical protein
LRWIIHTPFSLAVPGKKGNLKQATKESSRSW